MSRNPEVFSSAIGHTNLWDLEADALEARRSLIDTDAPDHTRLRRLTARAFTPKNIRRWEPRSARSPSTCWTLVEPGGRLGRTGLGPLPIRVILTMLGVPLEDADYLVELSNYMVEGTDDRTRSQPDAFGNTTELRLLPFNSPASHALFEYGEQLGQQRRADPRTRHRDELVQREPMATGCRQRVPQPVPHPGLRRKRDDEDGLTHGAMALADTPTSGRR